MKRRLAMLACVTTHQSGWSRITGEESVIRVSGLGEGDELFLEYDGQTDVELGNGDNTFHPSTAPRYRIKKFANGTPSPTTVEVICAQGVIPNQANGSDSTVSS